MSNGAIITENLSKNFGKFTAVDDINLTITRGSIHGFVGPNGAGKTTTIKMLIGAMHPTNGSGKIADFTIGSKESRQVIGYAPEKSQFYKDMNAMEYLVYMGQLSGLAKEKAIERAFAMLDLFSLSEFMYKRPYTFSSGMKKKMVLAQTLLHQPEILILDEPTANLDPETRMFIIEILKKMVKDENLTVFISSHILTELELLVNEVTLINQGSIVLTGKIDEIKNRFNQGVLDVSTNNNKLLQERLGKIDYIDSVKTQDEILKVYTKEVERFKHDICKIVYDADLMLNIFNEEKITLDNIYKSVFGKGNGGNENGNL